MGLSPLPAALVAAIVTEPAVVVGVIAEEGGTARTSASSAIKGTVKGVDPSADLAVVDIDSSAIPSGVTPLGLADSRTANVGDDVTSGYLKRGATLAALAAELEVPSAALEATAAEFNRHAAVGGDPAFGRGQNVYQRSLGDADVKPNPCVAPIIKPPP